MTNQADGASELTNFRGSYHGKVAFFTMYQIEAIANHLVNIFAIIFCRHHACTVLPRFDENYLARSS